MNISERLTALRKHAPSCFIEGIEHYETTEVEGATIHKSADVVGEVDIKTRHGKGNAVIRGFQSEAHGSRIVCSGSNNTIFLGAHSRLSNADIRITGDNNIFYFGAFSTVESMIVMLTGPSGNIVIQDFCMLSARIIIDRSDHHGIYDLITGARINADDDVTIRNHVWIGRDVRINKGTSIDCDSIIGQASIVSGRLAGQTLFAGVPARPIREAVTWSRMKCSSISEMEESGRHKLFLEKVKLLRERIEKNSLD